jgi:hypothetical protein
VASYRNKLTKQAGRFLEAGETIVAGAKCLHRGGSRRRALGGVFGVVGALAAGGMGQGAMVGGRPLPRNMAVALTDRRLLVFNLSEATDRATDLTHSIPRADLMMVNSEIGKSFGMKAVYIDFSFADRSTAALEIVRPNTGDGEDLAKALMTSVG